MAKLTITIDLDAKLFDCGEAFEVTRLLTGYAIQIAFDRNIRHKTALCDAVGNEIGSAVRE
jgi:hypothetical protein